MCSWRAEKVDSSLVYTTDAKQYWCGGQESNCEWEGYSGQTEGKCVDKKPVPCKYGIDTSASSCDECPSNCNSAVCVFQENKCINRLTDDTRTATVNLKDYKDKEDRIVENASWYFQQLSPVAVPAGTFIALQIPRLGYIGIQNVDDSTGLILFSAWDHRPKDKWEHKVRKDIPYYRRTRVMSKGRDIDQEEFIELGSGIKLSRKMKVPSADKDYYLALQISDGGKDLYKKNTAHLMGYINFDGNWWFLGKFKIGDVTDSFMKRPVSFIENWSHVDTKESRKCAFGPLYYVGNNKAGIRQGIQQAVSAKFEYNVDNTQSWSHQRVNAKSGNNEIILETGGIADATDNHESFSFAHADIPQQFTNLMKNAGRLEGGR